MPDGTKPDQLPKTEDETVTPLDVATDLLLDSTIPAPIRKNAFKALDRLCSALIDVPVGALERRSAEKRAETKARIKIIEEDATQITGQMEVPAEYAQRAVKKYGEKILREQSNLDKICAIAVNLLKKEKSASSTNQSVDSGEEKTIDDDWLNSFEAEARQKSTEDMQLRFGRILAGEIRKPESYSIKTVKILGELDQNTAALFKKLCSVCVALVFDDQADGYVHKAMVPSLGGHAGQNVLSKYGLSFEQLNILNEYGLIISDYSILHDYNLCVVNENPPVLVPFRHQGRPWVLLPLPERDKNQECRVSGVSLSRAGCELFRIVDPSPMDEYTEDLKKFFAEQNLRMMEVPSQNQDTQAS